MTPFTRSSLNFKGKSVKQRIQDIQAQHAEMGLTLTWAAAKRAYRSLAAEEIWVNDKYQVNGDRDYTGPTGAKFVWWSIKTHDSQPAHDWREYQQIKNEIVGPQSAAFEVYPAEERLVDTANQCHLWVCASPVTRTPVGWFDRHT